MHWQLVLNLRSRHSKCTGAKVRDRGAYYKVAKSSGSESLSADDGCDWSTDVSDVRRCQSILVREQTQLELDTLHDGKPMEVVSQHVLDVVVLLVADD